MRQDGGGTLGGRACKNIREESERIVRRGTQPTHAMHDDGVEEVAERAAWWSMLLTFPFLDNVRKVELPAGAARQVSLVRRMGHRHVHQEPLAETKNVKVGPPRQPGGRLSGKTSMRRNV